MKIKNTIYVLPLLGIGLTSLLGFQRFGYVSSVKLHIANKFSGGSSAGFTGAPGEATCTQCHAGQVQSGDVENITAFEVSGLNVSTYLPGNSLDINVTTTSNVSRKGFQMTALDANNNPAGTFVIGTNTELINGTAGAINGRRYITHNSATNSSAGWSFTWNAPSADLGNITFYLATNKSNGNSGTGGDEIYISQYTLSGATNSLIETLDAKNNFQAGFSPSTNALFLNFETDKDPGELFLNIVDLTGKSVFTATLGKSNQGVNKQEISLPSSLKEGMYVVNLFIDNYSMQRKIRVIR
jgi:hypothetical protein